MTAWTRQRLRPYARATLLSVTTPFRPEDLRSYRDRPWGRIRAAKERHWAEDARRRGAPGGLAAGAALWTHMKHVDPSWPSDEERAADLAHHVAMASKFRRLVHVFPGR